MRILIPVCMMFACVPAFATAAPDGVDLAHLTGWDIVLNEHPIPSESYAAEELQRILQQSTGIKLEIVHKAQQPERHIFIGDAPAVFLSAAGMGPEDFRIVIRDNLIAIGGGRPRGTLYGVYTFLEDYLGVRFLTADHTCVPKVGGWRVAGPVDRTCHPPLGFRWSYYNENSAAPAFAARLRVNTVTDDPKLGGKTGIQLINHSFGRQIPSQKYGKEHPEYFAMIDGKRLAATSEDWSQTQPCLTNPDVLRIVTQAVLDELKANPKLQNISVSQNDNDRYCRCPKCAEIDAREGTPMGSLLTFVNAVADEVAKEHPKIKVGTLSYWHTRKPPKTLKPRSNVQVQLCSIECCELHAIDDPQCPKNREFCQDSDNWGRICSNISIWNYNTNFSAYQLPFPNLSVIEPNVRYFVTHQAKGIFMQAAGDTTGAAFSDLHNYVIGHLLWDPNRSGSQLRDEFLRLHYGRSATTIRRILEQLESKAQASGLHPNCYGNAKAFGFDEPLAEKVMAEFAEAMRLADNDSVRARVEKVSMCGYRMAADAVWELAEKAPVDPALAERMRPLVKQFFLLAKKYQVGSAREGQPVDVARQRLQKLLWRDQPVDF